MLKILLGLALIAGIIGCCAVRTDGELDFFDFLAWFLSVCLLLLIVGDM